MTEIYLRPSPKAKCAYCRHLLINLVGPLQTCRHLNKVVPIESLCPDYTFSQRAYDREMRWQKELEND